MLVNTRLKMLLAGRTNGEDGKFERTIVVVLFTVPWIVVENVP